MASSKKRLATLRKRGDVYYVRYIAEGAGDSRKSFSSGTRDAHDAKSICDLVDIMISRKLAGRSLPGVEETRLLSIATDNPDLYTRFVRHGLADPIQVARVRTLGDLVDEFFTVNTSAVKPRTVTTWRQAERLLFECFDRESPLNEFATTQAIEFRTYLVERKPTAKAPHLNELKESTIRRRCRCVKQFFAFGLELEWFSKNPFDTKLVPTTQPKAQDKHYLAPHQAESIIDRLPSCEWRLALALSRYAGLRVPSELEPLRWSDVDWDRERMRVTSPKTEHHEGHEDRVVPIWPTVMKHLRDCLDAAEPGEQKILPMLRGKCHSWCRKPVLRAIELAKLQPWPKLFNAMRASAIHDARSNGYSKEAIDAWFGNSDKVRVANYRTTEAGKLLDAEFEKARGVPSSVPRKGTQLPAPLGIVLETPQEFAHGSTETNISRPGRT